MGKTRSALPWLLFAFQESALAAGVTPYLPLGLEPEVERQIERVLILGDKPVVSRPFPAATVLDALPKACAVDAALCKRVSRYLERYTHVSNLTDASLELASTSGADTTVPNRYGLHNGSAWDASAQLYLQPSDYALVNVGGVAYDGRVTPTGSMVSLGASFAQVDVGFRPHWWSPMTDTSMLMSSEAPTMPSVSVSNYEPLTSLGLEYEVFLARMSKSNHILFQNTFHGGYPRLFGLHLSIEPVSGWSLAGSRDLQYGGDGRPSSLQDLFKAFFNPSKYTNVPAANIDQGFGNQQASLTSSLLFPGKTPFAVYMEYAGEDTSRGRNYLLGKTALSVGLHFPRVWRRFDITLEATEWQNQWYVHSVYVDGMTNDGLVIGNWFGDQRLFNDDVGGESQMARLGWEGLFGGDLDLRYRTLQNQSYGVGHYQRYHDLTVAYSRPWRQLVLGAQLDAGRDVFGKNFTRLAGFVRYGEREGAAAASMFDTSTSDSDTEHTGQLVHEFITAGVSSYRVRVDLTNEDTRKTGPRRTGDHFALGARRAVSEHSDLGARVEFDNIDGHTLTGVRLIDYRYRFQGPFALAAFLGAARYALATPSQGAYYGFSFEWRDVIPRWSLEAGFRYADSIARQHLLPTDPVTPAHRDSFYDIWSTTISVNYQF